MGKVSSVRRRRVLLCESQISDLAAGKAIAGRDMPLRPHYIARKALTALTCWPLQAGDPDPACVCTLLLQPQTTCTGQGPLSIW